VHHSKSNGEGVAHQKCTMAAWSRICGLNETIENISCGGGFWGIAQKFRPRPEHQTMEKVGLRCAFANWQRPHRPNGIAKTHGAVCSI
jgi:hypothetical protein